MRRKGASNSAQAAKSVLDGSTRFAGVGFGGYVGSRAVDNVSASDLLSLSGECQALLKQLSKRNATTKLKALQRLEELIKKDEEDMTKLMHQWTVVYGQLSRDLDKDVRRKSMEIFAIFVAKLKRNLAPFLKSLIGPWWIAQHDIHRPAAQIAVDAYHGAFSGSKATEAVFFCRQELVSYLSDNLNLTPETVADPQKESLIDRTTRFELVMSAALDGSKQFIKIMQQNERHAKVANQCLEELGSTLFSKPVLKKLISSQFPSIRCATYSLVQDYCLTGKHCIQENLETVAPMIMNTLAEKDPTCHNPMWDLLLVFVKEFPSVWEHASLEKAVMPKLYAYLRQGAFKSAEHSFTAVLPFLNLIPAGHWNGRPTFLIKVLDAAWEGLRPLSLSESEMKATLTLMHECFLWGLLSVANLDADNNDANFRRTLISATIIDRILPAIDDKGNEQRECALQFFSLCHITLAAAATKDNQNTVANDALQQLVQVITDSWKTKLTKTETTTVYETISDCLREITKSETVTDLGLDLLRMIYRRDIATSLTTIAFSGNHPSAASAASGLVRCTRAFQKSFAVIENSNIDETTSSLEFFEKLMKLIENVSDFKQLQAQFDLLLLSLFNTPKAERQIRWKEILRCLETEMQKRVKESAVFFHTLLLRLDHHICSGELVDLVKDLNVEEMERVSEPYFKQWTKNTMAGEICIQLIKLQSTLLSPASYGALLHKLNQMDFIEYANTCCPESFETLIRVLLSTAAVDGISTDNRDLWMKLVVGVFRLASGLHCCSEFVTKAVRDVWNRGQCLEAMPLSIKRSLAIAMHDALLTCVRSPIPSSIDPSEWGFTLADMISDIIRINTEELSQFFTIFFEDGYWCQQWNRNDGHPLHGVFMQCVVKLILDHGANLFSSIPSIAAPIFVEVLSSDKNIEAVADSVKECLRNEVLTSTNPVVTLSVLDKCLAASLSTPKSTEFCYASAVHSILQMLTEHKNDVQAMRVYENFSTNLAEYIRTDIEEILTSDSNHDDSKAQQLDGSTSEFLRDVVPVIRASSMSSVTNSAVDQISTRCMDALRRSTEGLQRNAKDVDHIIELVLECFPLPPLHSISDTLTFFTTPQERDLLIKVTQAAAKHYGIQESRLWRRCIRYTHQDMNHAEWDATLNAIQIALHRHCLQCENICEDIIDKACSAASQLIPDRVLDPPSKALLFIERLSSGSKRACMHISLNRTSTCDGELMDTIFEWASLLLSSIQNRPDDLYWDNLLSEKVKDNTRKCVRIVFCTAIGNIIGRKIGSNLAEEFTKLYRSGDDAWIVLQQIFQLTFEDAALIDDAVEGIDLWSWTTGVDAVSCLLHLVFAEKYEALFGTIGMKILASDCCSAKVIVDVDPSESELEERMIEQLEAGQSIDEAEYFREAGAHFELVYWLQNLTNDKLLLAWALLLLELEAATADSRNHIATVLRNLPSIIRRVFPHLIDLLPIIDSSQKRAESAQIALVQSIRQDVMGRDHFTLKELVQRVGIPQNEKEWNALAMTMYHVIVKLLPMSLRSWVDALKYKKQSCVVRQYTVIVESPQLIQEEFALIAAEKEKAAAMQLNIRSNSVKREVVAQLEIQDERIIELIINIPDCIPLKPITVACDTKVNISSAKLRRLEFAVSVFLANHRGTIVRAIEIWQNNLTANITAATTCIICFCVVHPTTKKHPDLKCNTCNIVFHSECIYRWFRQSARDLCPHCQSPWNVYQY